MYFRQTRLDRALFIKVNLPRLSCTSIENLQCYTSFPTVCVFRPYLAAIFHIQP